MKVFEINAGAVKHVGQYANKQGIWMGVKASLTEEEAEHWQEHHRDLVEELKGLTAEKLQPPRKIWIVAEIPGFLKRLLPLPKRLS